MKKKFSRWIQDAWYQEMYFSVFLVPLSLIYYDIVKLRAWLYRIGVFKQHIINVPVVVVGNLTVGGTGKTPLVLYLAQLLKEQGFKPAIISRGYGGQAQSWPQWVDHASDSELVGDEAVLMAKHADCPIVVGPDRVMNAKALLNKTDSNVIISDDGLQHYALARDIEIVVVDGTRRFGNGYVLPAGPLRESLQRLNQVDFVVVNGNESLEQEYLMQMLAEKAVNLANNTETKLSDFQNTPCQALAGIGNPQRFFDLLKNKGIDSENLAFPDHHQFSQDEITFNNQKPVLMTEKDAVKCLRFATDKHWFVPVTARLEEKFVSAFIQLFKEKISG